MITEPDRARPDPLLRPELRDATVLLFDELSTPSEVSRVRIGGLGLYVVQVLFGLRSLAVPLLVATLIFVKSEFELGAVWIGVVLLGVFGLMTAVSAAVIVGLCVAIASLHKRTLSRPTRRLAGWAALVTMLVLFPVSASWDTVEGKDSAGGLTTSMDAALLKTDLSGHPIVWYTEECC